MPQAHIPQAAPGDVANSQPLPGARFSLALLLCINLFNYVDRQVLAAVLPSIQKTFFADKPSDDPVALGLLGSLSTAFIISYMVTAPIFGWLADRMSRWLLIGISVTLWSIASGGSGLASTFTMLLITRLFVGIGEGGYGPAAPTILSDLYPVKRRGAILAWFYMAIPVGSALGYILGGFIGSRFGWRAAFLAVVGPGLIMGLMCFLRRDPPRGAADALHVGAKRAKLADYLLLFKNPSYVLDTAGMAAMTFAIGGIATWMPKYVADVRHAGDLGTVNMIFGGVTVAAGISGTLLGGLAGDKLRSRYSGAYFLVSAVGILLCCPFIALMLVTPFPYAWILIFMAEFFLFFNTGPSNAILANVTHPTIRATAFALNILLIHILGDAPASPILGVVAANFGWNKAFLLVTAATAIGGVLWTLGIRHLERDTAAVTGPHPPSIQA